MICVVHVEKMSLTQKEKKSKRKVYKCAKFKTDILCIFNVDITKDCPNKHSSTICRSCVNRISNFNNKKKSNVVKA